VPGYLVETANVSLGVVATGRFADHCSQFVVLPRLEQKVVGPSPIDGSLGTPQVNVPAEHDSDGIRPEPNRTLQYFNTAPARHAVIADDDPHVNIHHDVDRFLPAAGGKKLVAFASQ